MLVEAGQDQPEELLEVEHSVETLEVVVVAVCGKTNHPGGDSTLIIDLFQNTYVMPWPFDLQIFSD